MLNIIKTQLEYCNTSVVDMLYKLKDTKGLKSFTFIDDCIKKCEEETEFPVAWSESIKNCAQLNSLKKEDKDIFYEFGSVFGTTDLNGQLNLCSYYINIASERQNDAKEKFKTYGKVYSAMGFLSGTALAIILF